MIISVVLKLVAVAEAVQYYFKQMLSFHWFYEYLVVVETDLYISLPL